MKALFLSVPYFDTSYSSTRRHADFHKAIEFMNKHEITSLVTVSHLLSPAYMWAKAALMRDEPIPVTMFMLTRPSHIPESFREILYSSDIRHGYPNVASMMNHAISCGVTHLITDGDSGRIQNTALTVAKDSKLIRMVA